MFHKILIAVNNSEVTQQIFDQALALAKATNAELIIMYVLSPFDERYPTPPGIATDGIYPPFSSDDINYYLGQWESLKQEGIELLTLLTNQAIAHGVNAEYTQEFGDPGRMICEVARKAQADLIIIGRRGLTGIKEFFLGSVSNYVLHHAHCSVLTVQGALDDSTSTPQAVAVKSA
ncbi:universal stress protein [Calothrix sp. FACHB-1219]|uniref:universal stress protein n=1 Tax=unclassified Calothrix TaxID=2619626 RepID=UPI0016838CE4|nr:MULTISPECIES: universal stress protein [unclassified Calothrix]MBD2206853.1 universal stress protein [Calothrix sp. FACHB-168]MBD2219524.1 universal stress protein [Calothrix sp. FACHB-1219]